MIRKKEATRVWHDPGELCDPIEMLVEYAQVLKECPCMLSSLFQWALWLGSGIEQKECQVALHGIQGSPHSDTHNGRVNCNNLGCCGQCPAPHFFLLAIWFNVTVYIEVQEIIVPALDQGVGPGARHCSLLPTCHLEMIMQPLKSNLFVLSSPESTGLLYLGYNWGYRLVATQCQGLYEGSHHGSPNLRRQSLMR